LKKIQVTQFFRKPLSGAHSLERLFSDILPYLSPDIKVNKFVSPCASSGLIKRLVNIISASLRQGHVNHVTGEVHFLDLLLVKRKTILTILDCVMMETLSGWKRRLFWLFWLWLPEKRCSFITVISEATKCQVLSYLNCDPQKIKVIYCGVSEEFKYSPVEFNRTCPQILQVGTFPNKNIERSIESLEGLACKLVIVGELNNSHLSLLNAKRISYENYTNLSRGQLLDQYLKCDMLMFASTYEGFGMPIIEANAVGRPVLTSKLWSMPEVAGKSAVLVDPYDVASIREGVLSIIEDSELRTVLIRNGLENVKRFSSALIAEQYSDLYREVYLKSHKR